MGVQNLHGDIPTQRLGSILEHSHIRKAIIRWASFLRLGPRPNRPWDHGQVQIDRAHSATDLRGQSTPDVAHRSATSELRGSLGALEGACTIFSVGAAEAAQPGSQALAARGTLGEAPTHGSEEAHATGGQICAKCETVVLVRAAYGCRTVVSTSCILRGPRGR